MTVKVGINGFGRIGRNFYRAAKEQGATLKGESEQMRESSAKLAGDNTPEEHANTR